MKMMKWGNEVFDPDFLSSDNLKQEIMNWTARTAPPYGATDGSRWQFDSVRDLPRMCIPLVCPAHQ